MELKKAGSRPNGRKDFFKHAAAQDHVANALHKATGGIQSWNTNEFKTKYQSRLDTGIKRYAY